MSIKEFIKPEWKKFILPIVFIIFFLILINTFYFWGSVVDKYGCELISLEEEYIINIKQNNTLTINQSINKIESLPSAYQIYPIFIFLQTIDPIIPVPCGFFIRGNIICEYYITEDTYSCIKNKGLEIEKTLGSLGSLIFKLSFPMFNVTSEYKKASIITQTLNILLLFIEGYLISSVILFAYRRLRKR